MLQLIFSSGLCLLMGVNCTQVFRTELIMFIHNKLEGSGGMLPRKFLYLPNLRNAILGNLEEICCQHNI